MHEGVPSRRPLSPEKAGIATGWQVVIGIAILVGGYVLGIYHAQIFAQVAPLFGFRVSADTIDLSDVQRTYQALKANYDGELDDSKLIEGASRGLVEAVGDEYTVYMNANEAVDFTNDLSGNIGGGVGMEVGLRNDRPVVLRLLKDNPAEKAGVQVGDVISAVNDTSTDGATVTEVVTQVRGEVGTTVKLSLIRDGRLVEISVTRAEIIAPSAYGEIKNGVGILSISRFDNDTSQLARQAARQFTDASVKGVILDLRGNGGGYVSAAQAVAGLWLSDQVVVIEKAKGVVIDTLKTGKNALLQDIPTIVLVNASSASASEIVAGALQDYDAATIIGEKTFGKGSVQQVITLPQGAELKVTMARWYTPLGRTISGEGITPDAVVARTADDVNANKDPQLDAALQHLNR